MKRELVCVLLGAIASSWPEATAAELNVMKSVTLRGSPEATWSLMGDYCSIAKWDPGVTKCEITTGANNRPGAVRTLTLGDGTTMTEELVKHDAKRRTYTYKILESPLPILSYLSTIAVLPGPAGGSVVEWTGAFKAAPGTDDAAARTMIEEIYDAGLASLQAKETAR